jgi:hypothetical protein
MTKQLPYVLALGLAAAALGAAVPAGAMTRVQAGTEAEQQVLDDMVRAQVDLGHHWNTAALDNAGNAETVLLNAQQAGIYNDPKSLAAIERAQVDLRGQSAHSSAPALRTAESDLVTPGVA